MSGKEPTAAELLTLDIKKLRSRARKISPLDDPDEWACAHLILGAALRARSVSEKCSQIARSCKEIIKSFESALELYCPRMTAQFVARERPLHLTRKRSENWMTLRGGEGGDASQHICLSDPDAPPPPPELNSGDLIESEGIELVVLASGSSGGSHLLEQAVNLFRQISSPQTRERDFAQWVANLSNLGCALSLLAKSNGGGVQNASRLEEAVDAFRRLLNEPALREIPSEYATVNVNLAHTLQALSEMALPSERIGYLESSINALAAALEVAAPARFKPLLARPIAHRI